MTIEPHAGAPAPCESLFASGQETTCLKRADFDMVDDTGVVTGLCEVCARPYLTAQASRPFTLEDVA